MDGIWVFISETNSEISSIVNVPPYKIIESNENLYVVEYLIANG